MNNTEPRISENLENLNSTVGAIWEDVVDLKNRFIQVADSEMIESVFSEAKDVGEYVKENWKKILAISAAVGLSAYLFKGRQLQPTLGKSSRKH